MPPSEFFVWDTMVGLKNEFMIENYLAHQGEHPPQLAFVCHHFFFSFLAIQSLSSRKWVNAYDPNSLLWISKAQLC